MVSTAFLAGLVALLVTRGPTNTLLLVAGATGPPRAAPWRLGAEAIAYRLAVTLPGFALQPVLAAEPGLAPGVQVLAASYRLHAAWRMWHRPLSPAALTAAPVTPGMIAVMTLLNPKIPMIAFGLMPAGWNAQPTLAFTPLTLLAMTVSLIGGLWSLAGHRGAMKASPRTTQAIVPRCSAVMLTGFASLLARSAFAAW
ncbi:MAG: hypothetical protein NTZ14_16550 [Hyphomicrobiales bacterium]|nr:hypothetical protein [Hyphomicrobiales bacterium]